MNSYAIWDEIGVRLWVQLEKRLKKRRKGKYVSDFVKRQQELHERYQSARQGRLRHVSKNGNRPGVTFRYADHAA